MKNVLSIILSVIVSFLPGLLIGCNGTRKADDNRFEAEKPTDSLKLLNLKNDIVEMVESTYANRNISVDGTAISLSDTAGRTMEFNYHASDSTIYMYFTPFACWDCIRTICKATLESTNGENVLFIIPDTLRNASHRILTESNLPASRLRYLKGSFGLPVEKENKVFFFTLSASSSEPGVMTVTDIFVPIADADAVQAYLDILADR